MADTERNIIIDIQTNTHKAQADIKRLNGEIGKLSKQNAGLKKTTAQVNQMTRSFASLATHLGRLALIYGAFQGLQTTVRTFAEFEKSMKRLEVISGATEEELARLNETAKALGESTIYTASQVAEGMNAMAMAGLSAEEQLAGISGVLDIATIGMVGLDEAALITTRAMNAFGLESQDMAKISDVLATGATNSAQTVTQLGNAYEKVGAVATAFNVSIEETTTALEIMADAGRVGSEAGTQLKIVLSRLGGNKEATKYITELGLDMYDANKRLLPFKEQLVLLKTTLGNLDEKARNIKLSEIFGEEGKASAIILMNNLDNYDAKLKQLQGSFGTASMSAQEMMNTLIGSWQELQSALQGLAINIGEELTPVLRELIDDATHFVQSLDDAEVENFANSVAALFSIIGDLTKSMVGLAEVTSGLAGQWKDMTGISAGWVVALGAIVIKLKKLRLALIAVGTSNIYLLAIVATLVTLDAIIVSATNELQLFISAIDQNEAAMQKMEQTTRDYKNTIGTLTDGEALEYMKRYGSSIEDLTRNINNTKDKIKELEESWGSWTKKEKEHIAIMYKSLGQMITMRRAATGRIEDLKEIGIAARISREAEIKAINDTRNAQNEMALDSARVSAAQITALDKSIAKLNTRRVTAENALGSMMAKERKFLKDIVKLEAEKAKLYKKYADDRETLEFSLATKIANVRATGLNDLQQYNDAQLRAEQVLAQAKEAFAKGNIEMAKTYLSEYDSLISQSAGEEIKLNDKVVKSKKATANEFITDAKNGHAVMLQIINEEERRSIEAQNAKIDAKMLEMEVNRASIALQVKMIELLGQMIAQAKGVKFEPQLDEFYADLQRVDKQIETWTQKQRKMKIEGDVSDVEKKVEEVGKEKIEPEVDVKTEKAVIKMTGFQTDAETGITKAVDLDSTIAREDNGLIVEMVSESAIKPVDLDPTSALQTDAYLVRELSKPIHRTVYTNYVDVGAYQVGGLIRQQPRLPRFADGGNLDSGVGHSRRTGSLNGYGGGDKIKALLEAGEFIVRKEAVRSLGLARLHTINQGRLPRFQAGGQVTPRIPRFATGGGVTKSDTPRDLGTLTLQVGGKDFKVMTSQTIADSLAEYLNRSEF